jgi:hypothetical protein
MPKTHNNLWERITGWDNLLAAYRLARRGKRYRREVLRFTSNLEENLLILQGELMRGTWRPLPPFEFAVTDPKPRMIQAPAFRDRIVHHALVRVVEPLFERRFIHHSYGCRVGKGTHAASDQVQQLLRKAQSGGRAYVLQGDIRSYFQSIRHDRLLELLGRVIRDRSAMRLYRQIIESCGVDGVGIPVGALTSQLAANVYLDRFDHYITDELGIGAYLRYMDDWVIVGHDKRRLWDILDAAAGFLASDLGLSLNPKTAIYPATQGVDFCGYRVWPTHRLIRKRSARAMKRRLKALQWRYSNGEIGLDQVRASIASWVGHARHAESCKTRDELLRAVTFSRNGAPKGEGE